MASTRVTRLASAWARRSGEVSTRIWRTARATADLAAVPWSGRGDDDGGSAAGASIWIRIDGRVRRSRGSGERQTSQSQPIIGTPCEVPVPSSVTLRLNNAVPGGRRLDKSQAELVQALLEPLPFFRRQVAARLPIEQRQNLDHLSRAREIRFRLSTRRRIREVAEMNRGGARQRQHKRRKRELVLLRLIGHRQSFYRASRPTCRITVK